MTRLISLICSSGNVTGDAAHVAEAMAVVTRAKIHIEALKILQRVRQGQEAMHPAVDVRTDRAWTTECLLKSSLH